jgi:hypothetical protein
MVFDPPVKPEGGVRATFEVRGEANFAASQHDDGNAVAATAYKKVAHAAGEYSAAGETQANPSS